jgi:two-component system response regulator YesN
VSLLNKTSLYKVIIVEDEELILNSIVRKVEKADLGFKVVATAQDGIAALDLIEKHSPDLLITDIRMPLMDGIELLKIITLKHPYIRKIILSGYNDFLYAQKALKYDVKDYLLKPVTNIELIESLNRISIAIQSEKNDLEQNKILLKDKYDYTPEQIAHLVELYIRQNYVKEINFDLISNNFNFNSSYLSRIFTKYIGESPSKYVITLRINQSKHLLLNNKSLSIKEIGEMIGYNNQFYFSRIFKSVTGKSPASYRSENPTAEDATT